MSAYMVVCMRLQNDGWMQDYFTAVPALLAEYGGKQVAGTRNSELVEGDGRPPDRIAILKFPHVASARRFLDDPRYQPFLRARRAASVSQIYLFENEHGLVGLS